MKYFIGKAIMDKYPGVSDYELTKDKNSENVAILRGTFTIGELQDLVYAMKLNLLDFEFSETIKNDPNNS